MDEPDAEKRPSPSAFHFSGKVRPGEEFAAEVTVVGPVRYVVVMFFNLSAIIAVIVAMGVYLATH